MPEATAGRAARWRSAPRAARSKLDEGGGIAPGEEGQIFGSFRRGRAGADGKPGTGLVLAAALGYATNA